MSRTPRPALAALAGLLLAASPVAAASWIVPGVANTPGANGSSFSSDLTLVNAAGAERTVTLSLIPAPGTADAGSRSYLIGSGATVKLVNVLGSVWSLTGSGALRVAADGPVGIFARTYNVPPVAVIPERPAPTFGAGLPVVEEGSLLQPGETGHSAWVTQSSDSARGDRTNVAVAFPDAAGGAATVTLFDEEGTVLGSISFDSPRPAFLQRSAKAFTPLGVSAGRIEVIVTRGRACGYTGTADNGTGDVTILPADRLPAVPDGNFFYAVSQGVAQVAGVNGSFWQTEARLANVSDGFVQVTANLLGVPGRSPIGTFSVPPGKTVAIRSLVASLFQLPDAVVGAVLWQASGPLVIAARTSTPASSPFVVGTAGAGEAALPVEAFLTPEGPPADLGDLRVGPFSRTNLLIVAGPAGATCTLEARDEAGMLIGVAKKILPLLGWTEDSLADLFAVAPSVNRVRIRVLIESGAADVEAAVVDSTTNDLVVYGAFPRPVFVPGPALLPGIWGSADGSEGLKVDPAKIVVERFCQTGTFPQPPRLDATRQFAVLGTYLVNIGPSRDFMAALTGQTDGQTATVSVRLLDSTLLLKPTTYFLGKPYTLQPGPCPVEY